MKICIYKAAENVLRVYDSDGKLAGEFHNEGNDLELSTWEEAYRRYDKLMMQARAGVYTIKPAPSPSVCRVIIAGGRDYNFNQSDRDWLADRIAELNPTEIVHGGATGADADAHNWATRAMLPIKVMPALWNKHGRAAGPIRNREMAGYANVLLAFPGGPGTANMVAEMIAAGKPWYPSPSRERARLGLSP